MANQDISLLTTGQAAKLCSVTPDAILKWIRKGRLEAARTAGGHYLIERLAEEDNDSIVMRFARNSYDASATIQDFRPAFAVVDEELLTTGERGLLDSMSDDPRIPGLRIILVVPQRGTRGNGVRPKSNLIVDVIDKPFRLHRIADVINRFPVDSLPAEKSKL